MLKLVQSNEIKKIEPLIEAKRSLRRSLKKERDRLFLMADALASEDDEFDELIYSYIDTLKEMSNKIDLIKTNLYYLDKKLTDAGVDSSKYF